MFQLSYYRMVQNLYKNWLQILKIIGIWKASDKQWKVEIEWDTCLKTVFLHLKHYLQIYLTLFSTTCLKVYQIPYVVFETVSHFTRKNSPILFCFFWQRSKFSDFSLLKLKFIKFLTSFFKQKVSFSLNFGSLFSVMRDNPSLRF